MTVNSIKKAWEAADNIFPTDYIKDEALSLRAGYDIYLSTADGNCSYISDLGDRLEVNLDNGKTVNIWIDEAPQFQERQIAEALRIIDEAIYQIDDNILPNLQTATGIDKARSQLYGAYDKIAAILKQQHPESTLFATYNLD